MGRPSPASRRAALEAQRQAALQARRRGRIIGGIAGAAVGILGAAALYQAFAPDREPAAQVSPGSQLAVPRATPDDQGIMLHPSPGATRHLVVYEDYQCPACKKYGDVLLPLARQLAAQGVASVEVRSLTLLDTITENDSSRRANVAAACADVSGRYPQYHDALYAHQPAKEGDGFGDQQLRVDLAAEAGIAGEALTNFQDCYDQRRTDSHVTSVLGHARIAGQDTATPSYHVESDGGTNRPLDLAALFADDRVDLVELRSAIESVP